MRDQDEGLISPRDLERGWRRYYHCWYDDDDRSLPRILSRHLVLIELGIAMALVYAVYRLIGGM